MRETYSQWEGLRAAYQSPAAQIQRVAQASANRWQVDFEYIVGDYYLYCYLSGYLNQR